jgi:hypothetical protein
MIYFKSLPRYSNFSLTLDLKWSVLKIKEIRVSASSASFPKPQHASTENGTGPLQNGSSFNWHEPIIVFLDGENISWLGK